MTRDIKKELARMEKIIDDEAEGARTLERIENGKPAPRELIDHMNAIDFLNRVVRGDMFDKIKPSISDRIRASKMLLDKTLPDLKSAEIIQKEEFNINVKYSATNDLLIEAQEKALIIEHEPN